MCVCVCVKFVVHCLFCLLCLYSCSSLLLICCLRCGHYLFTWCPFFVDICSLSVDFVLFCVYRCFFFTIWSGLFDFGSVCSLLVHRSLHFPLFVFTRCSLVVHSSFTRCSLVAHSLLTRCSLVVHPLFTHCSPFDQFLYTFVHHYSHAFGFVWATQGRTSDHLRMANLAAQFWRIFDHMPAALDDSG